MVKSDFYVYVIFRLDGTPCYVGKGRGRRWKAHFYRSHNPHLTSIINAAGGDLPIVMIRSSLTNDQANEIEIAFIAAIKRKVDGGPLVNMTIGGDGPSGHIQTEEHQAKKRAAMLTPENREKARQRALGNTNRRGKSPPESTIEKLRISHLGNRPTDETKAKMTASQIARWQRRKSEHVSG